MGYIVKNALRRRHKDNRLISTESATASDIRTPLIDWHRHELCTGGQQCPTRSRIPGIFDPGRISWIKQHACDQIKGTLRSGGEDDLFRRAVDTARHPDVRSDGLAQRGVALNLVGKGDGLHGGT